MFSYLLKRSVSELNKNQKVEIPMTIACYLHFFKASKADDKLLYVDSTRKLNNLERKRVKIWTEQGFVQVGCITELDSYFKNTTVWRKRELGSGQQFAFAVSVSRSSTTHHVTIDWKEFKSYNHAVF